MGIPLAAYRQQIIELGNSLAEIVFWDGPGYDSASRRTSVVGTHAEMLAAFDRLAPMFEDCDFDLTARGLCCYCGDDSDDCRGSCDATTRVTRLYLTQGKP
jgi:hypothetical protein